MLLGTGYFKTLPCPFFENGLCERPYCHFKHDKSGEGGSDSSGEDQDTPEDNHVKPEIETDTGTRETVADPLAEPRSYNSALSIAASASACGQKAGALISAAAGQIAGSTPLHTTGQPSLSAEPPLAGLQASSEITGDLIQSQSADGSLSAKLPSAASLSTQAQSMAAVLPPSAAGASALLTAAAGSSIAAVAPGIEQDKLEKLIQDAVRKVLLGEGSGSGLEAQPTLNPPQIKEEVDDDIIVEFCSFNPTSQPGTKPEAASEAPAATIGPTTVAKAKEPKLFLPPPGTPAYTPTPIQELEKRRSGEGQPSLDEPPSKGGGIPSGLVGAVSSLVSDNNKSSVQPKSKRGKQTFSYHPESAATTSSTTTSEPSAASTEGSASLLGDTGDISESDESEGPTPDIVGDILKQGNNSGVLSGGLNSHFQEIVIKERLKNYKKKLSKKKDEQNKTEEDEIAVGAEIHQCEEVSSTVDKDKQERRDKNKKEEEKTGEETEQTKVEEETEQEKEERLLREEEEEVRKLEEKRLILENFYKSRIKQKQQMAGKTKSAEARKNAGNTSGSISDGQTKSGEVSRQNSTRKSSRDQPTSRSSRADKRVAESSKLSEPKDDDQRRHHTSKKSTNKSSRQHRKHSSSSSSTRHKSSHHKHRGRHRRRRDSSSSEDETDDSETVDSSSDSSDSETERRKHRHSRKTERKSKRKKRRRSSSYSNDEAIEPHNEPELAHPQPKAATGPNGKTEATVAEYSEFNEAALAADGESSTLKHEQKIELKKDEDESEMDEFKRAEMKIRELLAVKNNEPQFGNFKVKDSASGKFVKPATRVNIKPPTTTNTSKMKEDESQPGPSTAVANTPPPPPVAVDAKPESAGKDQATTKPAIKLRSLSELVVSKEEEDTDASPSQSIVHNVFHEEESFAEMIRRHETAWKMTADQADQPLTTASEADPQLTAASQFDYLVEPRDNGNDNDTPDDQGVHDSSVSFLEAISIGDNKSADPKVGHKKKKRDHHKSGEKTSSMSSSSKHKKSGRDDNKSRDASHNKSSLSEKKRRRSRSREERSHHRHSRSGERAKKSRRRDDKDESRSHRHHRSKEKRERKKQKSEEPSIGPSSPVPDLTEVLSELPDLTDEYQDSGGDVDIDAGMDALFAGLDDDDDLQRIFKDYQADTLPDSSQQKSKAGVETPPSASLPETGKRRLAYEAAEAQKSKRPLHMKKPQLKTPAQTMLDRYKKLQNMRQQSEIEKRLTEMTGSSDGGGAAGTDAADQMAGPSSDRSDGAVIGADSGAGGGGGGGEGRVAHQPRTPGFLASKTKQQLLSRQTSNKDRAEAGPSTVAGTSGKGKARVAHTPTSAAATKPTVVADPNSKVPTSIRQRYLDSMVQECLKIYSGDTLQAYPRAEQEEKDCCRKASSRMIYLNLAVNKIKKLRAEKAAAPAKPEAAGASGADVGKRNMLTTHMQVLAGRPGTVGTWSIEKPVRLTDDDIDEDLLYGILRNFVLTEEQLVENGYPRPDPNEPGKAIVKIDPARMTIQPSDPEKRICDRCKATYKVDKHGLQVEKEECIHHWGRLFHKRGNRATGGQSVFYCCQQPPDSTGCQVGKVHVTDVLDYNNMRGFVSTLEDGANHGPATNKVFALDCEMCNTSQGNELTRVTVIDHKGEVCYETMVKPEHPVIDYNTRFSGITEADLKDVTTSIYQVQAVLLMKFGAKDILIGHSLESDLKALKILHSTVVDTSVVFPHRMGPPFKRALRFLAADYLKRIIQNDEGGHDSKEDALACLDLMKVKVKEEVVKLQNKARIQALKNQ